MTGLPAVLLTDERCRSTISIAVGLGEASSIAAELNGVELERPSTHQLMGALLESTGVTVERIEIHALRDSGFYAHIHLRLPTGERVAQEGRTSDALALALHLDAEIRVALSVLDQAVRAQELDALEGLAGLEGLEALDGLEGLDGRDAASPWEAPCPDWSRSGISTADVAAADVAAADLADVADEAFGKWKM